MAMDLNKLRAKKGMPIPEAKTTATEPTPKPEPQPTPEAKQEQPKRKVETKAEIAARREKKLAKARLKREKWLARGTPAARDERAEDKGRLPDGSRFEVQWDATEWKWSGFLIIETESGLHTFADRHRGVFGLLEKLDVQYREWLARSTGEAVPI